MQPPTGGPAVPVTVLLRVAGPQALAMRRYVERDLGWHVVDRPGEATVVVADGGDTDPEGHRPAGGPPTVLLVDGTAPPAAAAAAVLATGAAAVVGWPDERARLPAVVGGVARTATPPPTRLDVTVGGAAGGVGTTTVALAVAGWLAWSHRRVLVLASGPVPAPAAGPADPADLTATTTWSAAVPAAGCPGLRTVATTAPAAGVAVDAGAAEVVLRDLGVTIDGDVLVVRGDGAGLEAVAATTAGAVVLVGGGPLPTARLVAAAGGRRVLAVPWSARVARAALARRVPAGLPGRWLALLRPLADSLVHSASAPGRAPASPSP